MAIGTIQSVHSIQKSPGHSTHFFQWEQLNVQADIFEEMLLYIEENYVQLTEQVIVLF